MTPDQQKLLREIARWHAIKMANSPTLSVSRSGPSVEFKLTELVAGDHTVYIFKGWALGPVADEVVECAKKHRMAVREKEAGDNFLGEIITVDPATAVLFKLTWGGVQ